ncbi:DEAD/DEAH box helicase [Pseudarthrobacter oxydans]|uniref:DEAD/DEAH box helicase n=1 Tax=Pseudarthrobacter oxydans TaxID=1671 RepID=UPI00381F959B
MKPDTSASTVLSTTRARAKMLEYRVAEADFNRLSRDPAILFSLAIGILGDVASSLADQALGEDSDASAAFPMPAGWEEDNADPQASLRFASTFFGAYIDAELDAELTPELSLLCAAAYYIEGSVGSAAVIVRQMEPPRPELAGGLGLLLYGILQNRFEAVEAPPVHQDQLNALLDSMSSFFQVRGDAGVVDAAAGELRKYFHACGSPRELLYADIIGAVCTLKLRNAAQTILPDASSLEAELWRPAFVKPGFPVELWPAQQRIAKAGVLKGRSVVIQMPTSAGKTRATELIIRSAFLSRRANLAVIVAPYRSLCHDIRGDLVTAFSGENIRIDEATDSYQVDLTLDDLFAADSVLIVTPEKLLYMLRRAPELADRIGLVIYDEGHQFDGITRGPTYELLLTSLRMALRPESQIILISAVIGNANDVAEWLLGDRDAVLGGTGLMPTAKSIAFSSWQAHRGRLEYVDPQDPTEREFFVPRVISDVPLQRLPREKKDRRFPEKNGGDVGLFLGLHVVANGSVAVFCGQKLSVTSICRRAVDLAKRNLETDWPLKFSDAQEVESIRSLLELQLGETAPATQAARLGIFAHHADTPRGIRLAIEHAMKFDRAKFVVCTSTLAQGVNFPLKYLIVTTTQQGGERILVRDFHNLVGRAGRSGMHTEGSVIFSTPTIYDERNSGGWYNWQKTVRLLDSANMEPSGSSILSLFEPYNQRRTPNQPGTRVVQEMRPEWLNLAFADAPKIEEVVNAALEVEPLLIRADFREFIEGRARAVQNIAAFLVANMTFAEGENASERIGELAANTLAYHLADDDTKLRLLEVFHAIGASIAAHTDGDQRAVIRLSPLPPAAVSELRNWLTENLTRLQVAVAEDRLLDEIALIAFRFASSTKITKLTKQEVLPRTLREWVAGHSYASILATLTEVKARFGGRGAPTVEDVVALCEGGFSYDLAMIVASIADLAVETDETLYNAATLLQRQIKSGLKDGAALAFHEAGFADRHVAAFLGGLWPLATDRASVRAACQQEEVIRSALIHFPSYFTAVAAELGGWGA